MDKSSVTWTRGPDWWLSRTTMGGKERYPKQIRVGDLDRPRVYYPVDRDALLALADEMDRDGKIQRTRQKDGEHWFVDGLDVREYARRIRDALGVCRED